MYRPDTLNDGRSALGVVEMSEESHSNFERTVL